MEPKEWRRIMDYWLLGKTSEEIGRSEGRVAGAIDDVLSKIRRNYDEHDERTAPIDKLGQVNSSLSPSRYLSNRELEYLAKLLRYGRTVKECSVIMCLTEDRVKELRGRTHVDATFEGFGVKGSK